MSNMSPISYLRGLLSRVFGSSTATEPPASTPSTPPEDPVISSFRLDTETSETFTLPDGRKLGYAQYGLSTGWPILLQHGIPGSRLDGAFFDEIAKRVGARIISADRPGMGWSSPHPNRTLLDHAKDYEYLANHLGLEKYSVLGVSGGGPAALACAVGLPHENLKFVSLVTGLGPPDIGMKGAQFWNWIGFSFGFRIAPLFIARWFCQREPAGRLDLSDEERLKLQLELVSKAVATAPKKDLALMRNEAFQRFTLRTQRECFAHGFEAWLQDGRLMASDFGFRVEDIRPDLPVYLWYGKHDVNVPPNHGVQIAARLGGRARLRLEDETHGSLQVTYQEEYLRELVMSV